MTRLKHPLNCSTANFGDIFIPRIRSVLRCYPYFQIQRQILPKVNMCKTKKKKRLRGFRTSDRYVPSSPLFKNGRSLAMFSEHSNVTVI